jgi:phosphate acetyltransferase
MKGQVHTTTFLRGLLPSAAGLRGNGKDWGHVFHITVPGSDRPLLPTVHLASAALGAIVAGSLA